MQGGHTILLSATLPRPVKARIASAWGDAAGATGWWWVPRITPPPPCWPRSRGDRGPLPARADLPRRLRVRRLPGPEAAVEAICRAAAQGQPSPGSEIPSTTPLPVRPCCATEASGLRSSTRVSPWAIGWRSSRTSSAASVVPATGMRAAVRYWWQRRSWSSPSISISISWSATGADRPAPAASWPRVAPSRSAPCRASAGARSRTAGRLTPSGSGCGPGLDRCRPTRDSGGLSRPCPPLADGPSPVRQHQHRDPGRGADPDRSRLRYRRSCPDPPPLDPARLRAEGDARGERAHALANLLDLNAGYSRAGQPWNDEARVATRLSEERRTLRLARWDGTRLSPLCPDPDPSRAWMLSEVSIAARRISRAAPATAALEHAIGHARATWGRYEAEILLMPLEAAGLNLFRWAIAPSEPPLIVSYCTALGLRFGP